MLGAALLAAASCGARAQSGAAPDTTKLIIGSGSSSIADVPLYVALAKGFFKTAGLDVERQVINGGSPASMAAFSSGAINIINIGGPELIQYTANKVISGKAFAENNERSFDVVTSRDITKIEDLKGKVLGVSALNSGEYFFLIAVLQHYGLSARDVTFLASGNPINRLAALSKGAIQGTVSANSLRTDAAKIGTVLIKSNDNPVGFPTNMFFASMDLITHHKPLLKTFTATLGETVSWMKTNRAEAAQICAKELNATLDSCVAGIDFLFDKTQSSTFVWSSTFAVNVEEITSALALMASVDPSTKGLSVDDVVDSSVAGTAP